LVFNSTIKKLWCIIFFNFIFFFFLFVKVIFLFSLTLQSTFFSLASNLFFILIFTLILLVAVFCFRPFSAIDFFFWFHPLVFNLLGIGFHKFVHLWCFKSNNPSHECHNLIFYPFILIIIIIYWKKKTDDEKQIKINK